MAEKRYRTPGEYPAGVDDFPKIINKGALYVDKTEYIYNMTRLDYVFLSRPRRFGKSLLCSTLEAYFQGTIYEACPATELLYQCNRSGIKLGILRNIS